MSTITLASNIDDIDKDLIRDYNWCSTNGGYLIGKIKGKNHYLHRVIAERMGLDLSSQIDHEDGDPSNNCRYNLRSATQTQNKANSKLYSNNKTRLKGVTRARYRWRSRIRVEGKLIHLGYFDTAKDAHKAYCRAADKYFGEFANHGGS